MIKMLILEDLHWSILDEVAHGGLSIRDVAIDCGIEGLPKPGYRYSYGVVQLVDAGYIERPSGWWRWSGRFGKRRSAKLTEAGQELIKSRG